MFPVLLVWAAFALIATQAGMARETVRMAVFLALIPVWFLAVYLLVTALAPLTHALWRKWGFRSFFLLLSAAILVDYLAVIESVPYIDFLNFVFVLVAIHQLGYAWHDGASLSTGHRLFWFSASLVPLLLLTILGPYPIAMIGVPGAELSNSMPPTIALLALGMTQPGLAVALGPWGRKLLDNLLVWTATVLMIGMIAICVGLAMTAAISIASPEGVTGVRLWVVALPFVGAALVGFGPVYRWGKS